MKTSHTLVVASGNPLRGDDALGPVAGDIVTSWHTPGVQVRAIHQLVPELLADMKHVERVLFIDAGLQGDAAFEACIIEPKKSRRFFGHHETPANLLALMYELEGRIPKAWQVSISAHSFAHGAAMTTAARDHLHAALVWIRDFLAEPLCTKSV